jgi:hypothetical protein
MKIEHFAIIFLIIGIIVLYLLSLGSEPEFVADYSKLGDHDGDIIITKGIVIDYDDTSRGETILTVLEPDDLESTLKIFIETGTDRFTVGDIIQAKGSVLRLDEDFLELVVVNDKDVKIVGHWYNYHLSIPELAHRLEQNPSEFQYLPVEITGYLKYEPRTPVSSIRLTEHPVTGMYTVKVDIPEPEQLKTDLHKGDLISLNVSLDYNENNFEYKLISKNVTLLKSYGDWEVTLQELMKAPFAFEGAVVRVDGYIHEYKSYYNYIVIFDSPTGWRSEANASIWVDISGINLTGIILHDDYHVSITGILYYDPQYFDYAIMAVELQPS